MGAISDERRERLARMRLYVITGDQGDVEQTCRVVDGALSGGADVIQLRKKSMPKADQYRLARVLRDLTRSRGALLIINDHADLAVAADADGVHLGQDDLPVSVVRRLPGFEDRLVGCSTHDIEQAQAAVTSGADYLGVGPIFATPTKPGRPAVGLGLVYRIATSVSVPFVAIGGIDGVTAGQVVEAGARAVAVVRAVSEDADPMTAARAIRWEVESRLAVHV